MTARERIDRAQANIRDAIAVVLRDLKADTGLSPTDVDVDMHSSGPSYGDPHGERWVGRVKLRF